MNGSDWFRKFGSRGEIEAIIRFKGGADSIVIPLAFVLECPNATNIFCWFTADHLANDAENIAHYWHFLTDWTDREVDDDGHLKIETRQHVIEFNACQSRFGQSTALAFKRWREKLKTRRLSERQDRELLTAQIEPYGLAA